MHRDRLIIYLGLCLMVGMASDVRARQTDEPLTYKTRQLHQTLMVMEHVPAEQPFRSTAAIDSSMIALTARWIDRTGSETETMQRMDAYAIRSVLNRAMGLEKPDWAVCHVWEHYIVPSLLADFDFYATDPDAEKALLIWPGSIVNGFWDVTRCTLPKPAWDRLSAMFHSMPGVIDVYLNTGTYPTEQVRKTLTGVRQNLALMADIWQVYDALYDRRLDEAYVNLSLAFANKDALLRSLIPPGRQLVTAYQQEGLVNRALLTLDLMARVLPESELPSDSLRIRYSVLDPEDGADRLAIIRAQNGNSVLVPTERRMDLAGSYLDVMTGVPVDLADFEGKFVFLDFWYSSCGPCIGEIPYLNAFQRQHQDRGDFVFLSIADDGLLGLLNRDELRTYAEDRKINYRILYDTREQGPPLAEQFNVRGYPSKFLLDPTGRIMQRTHGSDELTLDVVSEYLAAQ